MVSMNYKNVNYNVVLIDPSIATAGNGSSAANALKDFPAVLENNTCYLVRRTNAADAHAFINYQTGNTLQNIMILGMPKSNDPKWIQDLITDSEINNAWKADAAEYACIKFPHYGNKNNSDASNAVINSSILENCTGINLYCFRQDADAYVSNQIGIITAMFGNRLITRYQTNFAFYGCKFGVLGLNFDSDEYLASINSINDVNGSKNTQKYNQYGTSYISVNYAESIVIDKCIINSHFYSSIGTSTTSYYGEAIHANNVREFAITDTTINNLGTAANQGSASCPTFIIQNVDKCATVKNITYYPILHTNRLASLGFVASKNVYNSMLHVDNVTITPKKINIDFLDSEVNDPSKLYCGLQIGKYSTSGGMSNQAFFAHNEIRNYKVDCRNSNVKVFQGNFLLLIGPISSFAYPEPSIYENISVVLNDKIEDCFIRGIYAKDLPTVEIMNIGNTGSSGDVGYDANGYINNRAAITKIKDLYVSSPLAGWLKVENVTADIDKLEAHLYMLKSQLQINKFTYNKNLLAGSAIHLDGSSNYIRVKDLVVAEDRDISQPIVMGLYDGGSNVVYIDKCNREEVFDTDLDNTVENRYRLSTAICCSAGADGKFIQRNRNVMAQSWSVTRNGSESAASLRLQNNTTANAHAVVVCADPFKGFEVTPTQTGHANLVAYFAMKDFTETDEKSNLERFVLEVKVPYIDEKGNTLYRSYFTNPSNREADNSVWSDPEAIARKFVLPIEVTTLKPIEVKVRYSWYGVNGCVYFDPDVRIENM